MNFDRFILFIFFAFLPILWLPSSFLLVPAYCAGIFLCFSLWRKMLSGVMLSLIIGLSYIQINHIHQQAGQISSQKQLISFQVTQLLKQAEYQTAIATLADGKRIYLNWQASSKPQLDQFYQAELSIRPISSRLNVGNFDKQRWYFANHIDGIASVRKVQALARKPHHFRTKWLEKTKIQTEHLRTQGLLLALAFGERAWLTQADWQLFQQTSTAHLIAISGLHIGLTYWLGFGFFKGIQWLILSIKPRSKRLQSIGFSFIIPRIIGVLVAFFYCYLAGFSIPTLRTLFAIVVVLLIQFARRHYTPLQFWFLIVTLLWVLDPLTILSDSFWLSAGAVLSLILWYRFFPWATFPKPAFCKKSRFLDRLCAAIHLQLGIWFAFSPLQLFFFDGFAEGGFLANLLIVPLYSFVLVPLILFSLISNNVFHSWQFADEIAKLSYPILQFLAGWTSLNQSQQMLLLGINVGLLCVLKNMIVRQNWHVNSWWGSITILFFFISYAFTSLSAKAQWITFDVGQGLAQALVYREETSGQKKAIFYDTGASWGERDYRNSMANLEILPYLKRQGIEVVAIFLSHDDLDHAGGIPDLLAAYPQARLISSSQKQYGERHHESCLKGKKWKWGDFELEAIYPKQEVVQAKNEDSCIVLVKYFQWTWLWTGDSLAEQEQLFSPDLPPLSFLQIAHHGSKTSTSETLLARTQPQIAFISSGRWNPWRLPNAQVLARLKRQNMAIFNTAETGMITVDLSPHHWQIQTARSAYSPWYQQFFEVK